MGDRKNGVYGEFRRLWCSVNNKFNASINARPFDEDSSEPGPNIWLYMSTQYGTFKINLSGMTLEELTAFRYVVDSAIATALPVVVERDANAQYRFQEFGDDSLPRFYSVIPTIWNRPGSVDILPPDWQGSDGLSMVREPGRKIEVEGSGDYEPT